MKTDCVINPIFSNVCERGTKSCVTAHDCLAELAAAKLELANGREQARAFWDVVIGLRR